MNTRIGTKRRGKPTTAVLALILTSALGVFFMAATIIGGVGSPEIPPMDLPEIPEGVLVIDDMEVVKNIALIDGTKSPIVVYTYENISLADISDERKQYYRMLGNMTYEERQAYLDRIAFGSSSEESSKLEPEIPPMDYTEYEWSRSAGQGDWPESLMHCYSSGGNGSKGWRKSSVYGDGPLEAYSRDIDGAPCTFTWISCATAGDPRHAPGGSGTAMMKVQATISLDCEESGDAQVGANWGYYMKVYEGDDLVAYIKIQDYARETSYSGAPYAWGPEYGYDWDHYFQPEILTRNWVQNYGGATGDFWSISYTGIEPPGDLWYNYFAAWLWVE